jgi:hypothetical protein
MTQHAPAHVDPLDQHQTILVRAISDGRVVPFLGAGVNLCGRPPDASWRPGESGFLPSGAELARHFAEHYGLRGEDAVDLLRVAQYVSTMDGEMGLYENLRAVFDANYPPTPVHRFFATLPGRLRARGLPHTPDLRRRQPLIVTTNYDDVLERAFRDAGEAFHVLSYIADGRGKFMHWAPDADPVLVETPERYPALHGETAVILKIHGAIDRINEERDSYVITEDHYIDYLTRTDVDTLLPIPLPARLKKSQFLFLGYSLRDWNLRAMFHRLQRERLRQAQSWAVLKDPQELERRFWRNRDVEIIETELEGYFARLDERLDQLLIQLPEPPGRAGDADDA